MDSSELEPERFLEFLKHAYALKRVKRRGWMGKGIPRVESVADHSFNLALLSMVMADLKGLNVERSVGMALLHDLCESIVGDLTPKDRAKFGIEKSMEEEHKAIEYILSFLSPKLAEKYLNLWEEYKSGSTAEAKLVKELDRFERALQAIEYAKNKRLKKVLKCFWEEFLKTSQDNFLHAMLQYVVKTQK